MYMYMSTYYMYMYMYMWLQVYLCTYWHLPYLYGIVLYCIDASGCACTIYTCTCILPSIGWLQQSHTLTHTHTHTHTHKPPHVFPAFIVSADAADTNQPCLCPAHCLYTTQHCTHVHAYTMPRQKFHIIFTTCSKSCIFMYSNTQCLDSVFEIFQ